MPPICYGRGPQSLDNGLIFLEARLHSRWVTGESAKLPLCLQPLLITQITACAANSCRVSSGIRSHRSMSPAVNCVCEGSGLHTP